MFKEAQKIFAEYLAKKNLKLSSQRRTILKKSIEVEGHFSADDLLKISKKADPTISKATVYRTLALLKESSILKEEDFGSGKKLYEKALGHSHHDHFVCIRCGSILEFENQAIEDLQEQEAKKHKFKLIYHSLKLFGTCSKCH